MKSFNKGQGATEYLVLLAVVLIIALVSIALLGFFPGLATDAKITQAVSYWKEARPLAILEYTAAAANGYTSLVIQNVDASGTYTLTAIKLGSTANGSMTTTFAPGEIKTVTASMATGTAGAIFDTNVTLNYTSPNGVAGVFYGGKNIIGKYT